MAAYCSRVNIENIFGVKNITRWADLDNDADETLVINRIEWACDLATEYLNSRLVRGPYTIPFTTPPLMIVNMAAMYAGTLLYDGRQVVSSEEPRDQVSRQRKDFDRYLKQIMRGQLKLVDSTGTPLTINCENSPFVVKEEETDDETLDEIIADCC